MCVTKEKKTVMCLRGLAAVAMTFVIAAQMSFLLLGGEHLTVVWLNLLTVF